MAKIKRVESNDGIERYAFDCPGCGSTHVIPVTGPGAWGFNGILEQPTFTPSILVRSGHYDPYWQQKPMPEDGSEKKCWCTYNRDQIAKGEEPSSFVCGICHSFVTDGKVQFLGDCTHALAGQTVELPEMTNPSQ